MNDTKNPQAKTGSNTKRAIPVRLPPQAQARESARVTELMGDLDLTGVRRATEASTVDVAETSVGEQAANAGTRTRATPSSAKAPDAQPKRTNDPAPGEASTRSAATTPASISELMPGGTYHVPIGWLFDSPGNARVYYKPDEVDETSQSLAANGQDVNLWAYVEDTRVMVVDGGKRLRGARTSGVQTLRVDIHPKPATLREIYLQSRRMNMQRSTQSCFDDATRFRQLLDEKVYPDQGALGRDVGMSQETVSQILSLNKIPQNLISKMREEGRKLCQPSFAFVIATLFDGSEDDPDKSYEIADLLDDIVKRDLSLKQTKQLIATRAKGRRARAHPLTTEINYGGRQASMKIFKSRGQLDLSITGLEEDKLAELESKIKLALGDAQAG